MFDSERWLLEALALMTLSEQAIREGKTVYASSLLERAGQAGARTPYYAAPMERQRLLLRYRAGEPPEGLAVALPDCTQELLLRAEAALSAGETERCAALLDGVPGERDHRWHLLRGDACRTLKDYPGAIAHYTRAEESDPKQVYPKLEECYRALEDYKMAYYYACKQRDAGQ